MNKPIKRMSILRNCFLPEATYHAATWTLFRIRRRYYLTQLPGKLSIISTGLKVHDTSSTDDTDTSRHRRRLLQTCLVLGRPNEAGEERGNSAMTQLTSFQPLLPVPSHPVPSYRPAGTTQLTPFPSAAEGNRPTTTISLSSSSCPRLDLPLHYNANPYRSPPWVPTVPTLAGCRRLVCAPLLSSRQHTGAISTTARRGASCHFAEKRRACKASAKSPLWKKNTSLPPPTVPLPHPLRPSIVVLPTDDLSSFYPSSSASAELLLLFLLYLR